MQRPSVGRAVHYVSYGTPGGEFTSKCRAATITEVGSAAQVGLCVQNPTGFFFRPLSDGGCLMDPDGKRGGTWHWPERV